jgi:hypothetical protein
VLSQGVHDEEEDSDERCMEDCRHVRMILDRLAERLELAMKEDAEFDKAMKKMQAKQRASLTKSQEREQT